MIPHKYRRAFVKCLGVLTTDDGTDFGTVLVMGPFSELALRVVPFKLEQYAARFALELPKPCVPYIFYIGDDNIPPRCQIHLPDGQMAMAADIGTKRDRDVFFRPFLAQYVDWVCEMRDTIIEQNGFSNNAEEEWYNFQHEMISENPVYALFAASQEEMLADMQAIYNYLKDSDMLDSGPCDPYEYNGVSPSDFY